MTRLERLRIYPVKGLDGIDLDAAEVRAGGTLEGDRPRFERAGRSRATASSRFSTPTATRSTGNEPQRSTTSTRRSTRNRRH